MVREALDELVLVSRLYKHELDTIPPLELFRLAVLVSIVVRSLLLLLFGHPILSYQIKPAKDNVACCMWSCLNPTLPLVPAGW